MSSLHVLLYYIVPEMGDMPMIKFLIIEMVASILETCGINLNDFKEVSHTLITIIIIIDNLRYIAQHELLKILDDKSLLTNNPLLKGSVI